MSERVFWPGDEIPIGTVVMGRDGSIARVEYPGVQVRAGRSDTPLVEVILPDYERVVADEGPARVDPPGCGCTDCIIGEWSKPLDQITYQQLVRLIHGNIENATGRDAAALEEMRGGKLSRFFELIGMDND